MMNRPFVFKAVFWLDGEGSMGNYGVVMAESFSKAAHQIEDYYGDDLLDLEVFGLEDGPFFFDKEMFDKLKEEAF